MSTRGRSNEIRELFKLSVEGMVEKSNGRLKVLPTLKDLYEYLAKYLADEFEESSRDNKVKAFILPVGPTQPYPILADMINRKKISLKNCCFFFMDEYCDDEGKPVSKQFPLSFRKQIDGLFFKHIDRDLNTPEKQIIFPDLSNINDIPGMIDDLGGIDLCYGGIGIHGHLAFNEPAPGVKDTDPRVVDLNEYTRTIDTVRHGIGGNLINFPRKAITLGMKQILSARKLLLCTRNEIEGIDWANTVLRISVLGKPGDDYPVTYIREHDNYLIVTDRATASAPEIIL